MNRKIGLAALIMMASVFGSRVIGLVREMVIAYAAGAGGAVDAYQVAFVIPELLNHLVATGYLSITFIPMFARYLVDDQEGEGWRVFSVVLTTFGSLLALFIVVAAVFAPLLISVIAPGLEDPVIRAEAVRMTRIILPAQFFFFTGGLLMAVQFAKERFFIPALAPLFYNLGIILGGVLLGPRFGMAGFSWGVLAGALVGNFGVQCWGARKVGLRFRPIFDLHHPELKKYIRLTLPLIVGLSMYFSAEFFLKFFGSYLPRGNIAGLNYGLRIMLILVGLFGQAVGTASFPFMARLVAENRLPEMNRLLNTTLRYLAVVIPISVMMIVLRCEIVRLLFQRGRFDAAATEFTAGVLAYFMIGAFAFAVQTVVVRGYYAMQNTLFPAVFGTAAVLVSVPLYLLGMELLGAQGVALAVSLSAFLQVALLFGLWNRKSGNVEGVGVYALVGRVAVGSLGLGLFLEWVKNRLYLLLDASTFSGSLAVVLITGSLGTVVLAAAGYGFRIREVTDLIDRLVDKGRRFRGR
jgi:putative peptidoglycan lipid II flippase